MSGWPSHARAFGLWLLAGALAGLAWMLPPIAQPPAYHAFADQRVCWFRRCCASIRRATAATAPSWRSSGCICWPWLSTWATARYSR